MGRPRTFDESTALTAATEVFWQKGYLGAKSAEIAAACGLHEPSLFGAFGNKRELFSRCLDHYAEHYSVPALTAAEKAKSPLESLMIFLRALEISVSQPTGPKGCFLTNSLAEAHRLEPELGDKVRAMHQAMLLQIKKWLVSAKAKGELKAGSKPDEMAATLAAQIYGWGLLANLDVKLVHDAAKVSLAWLEAQRREVA
jgi:TetR/AcrR family transcriptional regulator, transcriptional repressor for nem operon